MNACYWPIIGVPTTSAPRPVTAEQPTFRHRCLIHGAPNLSPESRAAIALLIDAATADLARRRAVPKAATKISIKDPGHLSLADSGLGSGVQSQK